MSPKNMATATMFGGSSAVAGYEVPKWMKEKNFVEGERITYSNESRTATGEALLNALISSETSHSSFVSSGTKNIETKLKEDGYRLFDFDETINTSSEDIKSSYKAWESTIKNIEGNEKLESSAVIAKISEFKNTCKTLKVKNFVNENDADYKDAIKKCTKTMTLKNRAIGYGLLVIETNPDISQLSTDAKSKWQWKWRKRRWVPVPTALTTAEETLWNTTNYDWKPLSTACQRNESKNYYKGENWNVLWQEYLFNCVESLQPGVRMKLKLEKDW